MMDWSIFIGRLKHTELRLHWTYLILILWTVFSNVTTPGKEVNEFFWYTFFVLVVLSCSLVHEYCHIQLAEKYKLKYRKAMIYPTGGLLNFRRYGNDLAIINTALAGPLSNLGLGILMWIYLCLEQGSIGFWRFFSISDGNFIHAIFTVNIILFLINLIPAFPMDAGLILNTFIRKKLKRTYINTAGNLGQLLGILLVFSGMFFNQFTMLLGIIIFLGSQSQMGHLKKMAKLEKIDLRKFLTTNFGFIGPNSNIEVVKINLLERSENLFIVHKEGKYYGFTKEGFYGFYHRHDPNKLVGSLPLEQFYSISIQENLNEFYEDHKMDGIQHLIVEENGEVLGYVDLYEVLRSFYEQN